MAGGSHLYGPPGARRGGDGDEGGGGVAGNPALKGSPARPAMLTSTLTLLLLQQALPACMAGSAPRVQRACDAGPSR